MTKYGKTTSTEVYCIHVKIIDVNSRAKEMIDIISEKSWISKLGVVDQASYDARATQTITKLVKEIFEKIDSVVTSDFGEYLISHTASAVLNKELTHVILPLAELWKEKVSGNHGFDFHTESPNEILVFGEAKYNNANSPYTVAINQIIGFIDDKKDIMDLADLKKFTVSRAPENAINLNKGFAAAFSINALKPTEIFEKILRSDEIDTLLVYPEVYIIGVVV